jgi:hypothetical protein
MDVTSALKADVRLKPDAGRYENRYERIERV